MCFGSSGFEDYIAQLLLIVNAGSQRLIHIFPICADGPRLECRVYCHMETFQCHS